MKDESYYIKSSRLTDHVFVCLNYSNPVFCQEYAFEINWQAVNIVSGLALHGHRPMKSWITLKTAGGFLDFEWDFGTLKACKIQSIYEFYEFAYERERPVESSLISVSISGVHFGILLLVDVFPYKPDDWGTMHISVQLL